MKQIQIENIKQWNSWLKKNHDKEKIVQLILHKRHTGKPAPTHKELMHEAICFGWIDTTIKKLDEDKYIRTFARRSQNSKWSYATLSYAKSLVEQNRMTPHGMKFYEEGKKKLPFDHGIPKNPEPPTELLKMLKTNKKAEENFKKLAPSYKRTYLRWIIRAKQKETQEKRMRAVVKLLEQNRNRF